MENNNNGTNQETSDISSEEHSSDLRRLRESKSLTLREIARVTRISHAVLGAIEAEEFEALPEPIYATAFIKKYAEILGIDGEDILNRYNNYLKEQKIPEREDELVQEESWIKSNRYLLMWGVFVIVIVSFFAFYFFHQDYTGEVDAVKKHAAEEIHENQPPKESESVKEEESSGQSIQGNEESSSVIVDEEDVVERAPEERLQKTSENESLITDVDEHNLIIKASELTWLEIAQDGTQAREFVLRPGEKLEGKAKEKFHIVVGNAGGVNIVFDGKLLGSLGMRGEVVRLSLP